MLLATIGLAFAVEGMWEPSQLPSQAVGLARAGFKGNAVMLSRLDAAPLGAVVSLGGCTASFVSPDGLLVTNHHCVTGYLQQATREGENLVDTGFLARTRSEERSVGQSGRVYVTTDIEDVTEQVVGRFPKKLKDARRAELIEERTKALVAACEKPGGVRCRVVSFYEGAVYRRITQRELRDLRLVMAPPDSVGSYGDEIDNWQWPRHAGDFAFVRAYVAPDGAFAPYAVENVPYAPPMHLRMAKRGPQPGEFVMVAGYPGSTDRWRTALEMERAETIDIPRDVAELKAVLEVYAAVAAADPKAAVVLEPARLGVSNTLLNLEGTLAGYRRGDIVGRARAREAGFIDWMSADPARAPYRTNLEELRALVRAGDGTRDRDFLLEMLRGTSPTLHAAETLVEWAAEQKKKDAKRRPGFQARDRARLRDRMVDLGRRLEPASERRLVARYLGQLAARADCPEELKTWLGLGAGRDPSRQVAAAVDRLFAEPVLAREEVRLRLLDLSLSKFPTEDGFVSLARALAPVRAAQREEARVREGAASRLRPALVEAERAFDPGRAYPDANGTLRVTYGTLQGYAPRDGVYHTPQTTLEGVAAKAGPWPFDAPQPLLDAVKARRHGPYADLLLGSVPVNFLSDLDITGGNSGSPTLNAAGELVGLAFDGNIEGVASDWFFDARVARTIHVDSRYVLWYLDAVADADALLRELGRTPAF
ncbi:MAG: hypothetical protein RLZZ299_1263 [Pseudomonadota bacterium]|jgi:hypothetical protein